MDVETLLGNIPPLNILALDYPSWIMKVKSALKILGIFDVIYEDFQSDYNVTWQSEAVAYRIVTEKIQNSVIASDICHFNYCREILDYLSSAFRRISSVPGSQQRRNFSRFVRRQSSVSNPRHLYGNGFGKGHGSDRSNWRKPAAIQEPEVLLKQQAQFEEAKDISNQKVSFSEQPITIPLVERTNVALMESSHSESSCDEFNHLVMNSI